MKNYETQGWWCYTRVEERDKNIESAIGTFLGEKLNVPKIIIDNNIHLYSLYYCKKKGRFLCSL